MGVRLLEWQQFDADSSVGREIRFTQFYTESTGSVILQEYFMTDDDVLTNQMTIFNPVTEEILDSLTYTCPVGSGVVVSAPARERRDSSAKASPFNSYTVMGTKSTAKQNEFSFVPSRPLVSYFEVYAAALDGVHLEVRINYEMCNDPTGSGFDFTGITTGAYLQEMFIDNPDSIDSIIFTSAYALVTNAITGEGFAYSSVDLSLDRSNVARVVPAYWSVEGGQLTNLFGDDLYVECAMGEGLIVYASRQD
ncbi:unnamed protein product [Darwinula stevensoni]|uniref:Uncharacterized protein n=1 Tax=Darwinula stevensoni TaxID=69355 RepID=A0A7R8XAN2_9CRUS|nr:unnamed protein product [Darwinula stevensoni]CAG0885730.1 unnamed protein product [Darwinula stevensoni]